MISAIKTTQQNLAQVTGTSRNSRLSQAAACSALALAGLFTGCGMNSTATTARTTVSAAATPGALQGTVFGGQQPVGGALIQLWAVNLNGQRGASTSIMNQGVTVKTSTSGGFSITGMYTCPSANPATPTYITATGGNPGFSGNVNNTGLALMLALGPCNTLLQNYPFVNIDEVTTVASVYALAGFMTDITHVGASANNPNGIANAFALMPNLVAVQSGLAPGPSLPATATLPIAEINTLANVISTCVNTDGTGTPCSGLFAAATPPGGSAPADTVGTLVDIAHNPANNVTSLFNMAPASPPFQPSLSTAPSDWTVVMRSTGGGLNSPVSLALDASGSVFVANSGGTTVTKLSTTQAQSSGAGGFAVAGLLGPQGIAVDTNGNAWLANSYGASVVEIGSTGALLSPAGGYQLAGITSPSAIAIDPANNVWVTNFDNATVSGLNASASTVTAISGSPFTAGASLSAPNGIAIDSNANVWITSSGNNLVAEISNTGATLSGAGYTDGIIQEPFGIAIDANARVYVASNGINDLSIFASNGTATNTVSGGSLNLPSGVATDGANVIFSTNGVTAGTLSMLLTASGTPTALGALNTPIGVAVDESGNVWTANSGDNSISEFIGLATPVRTPLANRYLAF